LDARAVLDFIMQELYGGGILVFTVQEEFVTCVVLATESMGREEKSLLQVRLASALLPCTFAEYDLRASPLQRRAALTVVCSLDINLAVLLPSVLHTLEGWWGRRVGRRRRT
jgi:hypothetical protein